MPAATTTKSFGQNRISGICYYCYPLMFSSYNNSITNNPNIFGQYNANIKSQPQFYPDFINGDAAMTTKRKAPESKCVPFQSLQATIPKARSHNLKVKTSLSKTSTTQTFSPYQQPHCLRRKTSTQKSGKNYAAVSHEFLPLHSSLVTPHGVAPYRPNMVTLLSPQPMQKLTLETAPCSPISVDSALKRRKISGHYYANISSQLLSSVPVSHRSPKIMKLDAETSQFNALQPRLIANQRGMPYRLNMTVQKPLQTQLLQFVPQTLQTTTLETPPSSPNMTAQKLYPFVPQTLQTRNLETPPSSRPNVTAYLFKQGNGQTSSQNQERRSCKNYGHDYSKTQTKPLSPYLFTQSSRFISLQPLLATTQHVTPYRPIMVAELIPQTQYALQSMPTTAEDTPPCSPNNTENLLKRKTAQSPSQSQQSLSLTYHPRKVMKLEVESQPSQKLPEEEAKISWFTSLQPLPTTTWPIMAPQLQNVGQFISTTTQEKLPSSPNMTGNFLRQANW